VSRLEVQPSQPRQFRHGEEASALFLANNHAGVNLGRWFMVIRISSLVLLGFALCAQLALAQVNTATISGTVHDASGAVLPGVSVVIQNQDTGISRTVSTNETGRYSAPALGLGNYQVTAQLQGFQSQVRSGIALTVGREAVVDFTLAVGAVSQ